MARARKSPTRIGEIVGAQVEELRGGLTQQQFVERLHERCGWSLDPASLSRLEAGQRAITVDELLLLARALDVAPVQLLAPMSSDEPVPVGNTEVTPTELRQWVRGRQPLDDQDPVKYEETVSRVEREAYRDYHAAMEEAAKANRLVDQGAMTREDYYAAAERLQAAMDRYEEVT